MLLSKSCVYGLRATLYLASNPDRKHISISELSEKLDISFHFLTKILQQLTAENLLESKKGPKGGVKLLKPADNISLLEVVVAIDGDGLFQECVLGLPGCGTEKPCPLHNMWANSRDDIRAMLEENNLLEMANKGKQGNLRITANGQFQWD